MGCVWWVVVGGLLLVVVVWLLVGCDWCVMIGGLRLVVVVWRLLVGCDWWVMIGGLWLVDVDWWVCGLLGGSFYHHPTPTTNIYLFHRQRTHLAWRANIMVKVNAYDTTDQHLFHC